VCVCVCVCVCVWVCVGGCVGVCMPCAAAALVCLTKLLGMVTHRVGFRVKVLQTRK
jgi:hypothetical protein